MEVLERLELTILPPLIEYEIVVGENLVDDALVYARELAKKRIVITTSQIVEYLPKIEEEMLVLPQNASLKSRATKEKIEDALIERGLGRETCIVAIGGGVLLDLAGFVAATYCRGIPYVSVPTTLLAMTDAAIGGKTSVNVEEAKNWIGAFYHPSKIFLDLKLLETLPQREFVYGLAETIKHSLIADKEFFGFLEENLDLILARDPKIVREMVHRSCAIKKGIIEQDPFEKKGVRRILNFGHTIGHALETLSEYALPHGQAVAMGMIVEAELAHQMDYLSHVALDRMRVLIDRIPFHLTFPDHLPFEMLKRDKKGAQRIVVLMGIGAVAPCDGEYTVPVTKELFEGAWDAVCHS